MDAMEAYTSHNYIEQEQVRGRVQSEAAHLRVLIELDFGSPGVKPGASKKDAALNLQLDHGLKCRLRGLCRPYRLAGERPSSDFEINSSDWPSQANGDLTLAPTACHPHSPEGIHQR